jgi:hypothetical protein
MLPVRDRTTCFAHYGSGELSLNRYLDETNKVWKLVANFEHHEEDELGLSVILHFTMSYMSSPRTS